MEVNTIIESILFVRNEGLKSDRSENLKIFDNFVLVIKNLKIINSVKDILNFIFKNKLKFNTKIFLTSYMIQYNHEDILNDNEHNNPEELINLSNELISKYEEICDNIINGDKYDFFKVKIFYNIYIEFEKILLNRKNDDKNLLVEQMTIAYYEIHITQSQIDQSLSDADKIWYEEMDKQKNKLRESIKVVGGNGGLSYLDNYDYEYMKDCLNQTQNISQEDNLNKLGDNKQNNTSQLDSSSQENKTILNEQNIGKILKKAFWDKMAEDMKQNPPNYDHMLSVLNEIKGRFNQITQKDLIL